MNRTMTFFLLSFFFVSSVEAQAGMALPAAASLSSLPAGQYVATVSPAPDQGTANGIQSVMQSVPGVESATIFGDSPALQITVKRGYDVDVGVLRQALKGVNPGLMMSTPQLAPALVKNPALGPVH